MAVFDLRYELLREHSKAQCSRIVDWVGDDQKHFDELFTIFLTGEYREVQHAAWPISYCVIAHPQLIKKHWNKLIKNLHKPNIHDAVKRNSMRLLQDIIIPKKYEGEIMDIAFKYVASPTEAVAVKAFSMIVLGNLAKQYPEILPELKLLIEDQLPHQTAAFKSRAKKILSL
jgi:hypothetical protein